MADVRWRTGATIASIITVAFMSSVVVTPLYPLYQRRLGLSDLTLTLVYAAYVLGNAVALLVLGRVSDQVGRRRTALSALTVAGASALVLALSGSAAVLAVGRVLSGVAVGVASATATAWLAEHLGQDRRAQASVVGAVANLAGIALGPLLGGVVAQHLPQPLRLPFVAYGVVLVLVVVAVARTDDTGRPRSPVRLSAWDLRPRIGVPRDLRGAFVPPAITGFVVFSLGGLYFAVVPGLIRRDLGLTDVSVSGVVVLVLGAAAVAVVLLSRRLSPARSMAAGLVGVLPSVALVVLAQAERSLPLLLVAAAVAGTALALGYRGSLEVVIAIAPDDHRAELTSSYFLAVFAGNSLPVIGIGLVSVAASPLAADLAFAVTVALLSLLALVRQRRNGPSTPAPGAPSPPR